MKTFFNSRIKKDLTLRNRIFLQKSNKKEINEN